MKTKNKKAMSAAAAFLFLMITGLVLLGISVWNDYKMAIISQQKDQMLLTAESVARNMEISLERNAADLSQLCMLAEASAGGTGESGEGFLPGDARGEGLPDGDALAQVRDRIFRQYIDEQENFVTGIIIRNSDRQVTVNTLGLEPARIFTASDMGDGVTLTQCQAADGEIYFLLEKSLAVGGRLSLVIDAARYYEALISDIRLGTNGYFVIKNSSGILLMHPLKEQLGLEVVEGRKELYHLNDLKSLEEMLEKQYQGKSGVSEYYSYWWDKETLPRVKKISAYTPVTVGDDFLIASAVMDYSDIYVPIANGYIRIILILLVMFVAVLAAAGYFVRLSRERQRDAEEIAYLRELNGILEETRRSEEIIAHQQRLQIMGTMTGGIAHEFNNLLTPIMGYADLLLAEIPEDSEYYEDVAEIYEASAKAKEIIRQISSLSRRNMETAYKEIAVRTLMARAIKMVRSVCPANICLEDRSEFADECILGNETQLNQVILNICVNAVHAIGHREGRITVGGRKVPAKELAGLPRIPAVPGMWKDFVRIDFTDDGDGMSADVLEQIFDPFFTTKTDGKGTGLGLALAEQIIHSHKGYICAESEPGKGSVFHIFLPVNEQACASGTASEDTESGKKFLIVDDNAKVLKQLEKNFKKVGISAMGAVNREEALAALAREHFDVILVDDFLSGIGAADFCMSIRMRYPHLIKVVMTGRIRREILEAKHKGILEAYVEKPVSVPGVLSALRSLNTF